MPNRASQIKPLRFSRLVIKSVWCIPGQNWQTGSGAWGLLPGDTVMLHASIRSVGRIAGGPDQIHLALKDALTADGTLLMYASSADHYDEVGRGTSPRGRGA